MNITELLQKYNLWWSNQSYLPAEDALPKREAFSQLYRNINNRYFIEGIIGIRRVGKTTLIRQLIASMIKNGIPRRKILFFSFEEEIVSKNPEILESIIDKFLSDVQQMPIEKIDSVIYLFFDEIQNIPYWQSVIKKYYDLNHHLKFIVSGSSSLFLSAVARESLTGRIFETIIPPLSFAEFLLIRGLKFDYQKINLLNYDYLTQISDITGLIPIFSEYLVEGQFPEMINLENIADKKQYLNNYILGKVLEYDLPNILKIRYSDSLLSLGKILIQRSGQLIELNNLAKEVGIKRQTLARYLRYLEQSLLVFYIMNKGVGFRERDRRQRKIYSSSSNFTALMNTDGYLSPNLNEHIGMIAESYVHQVLKYEYADFDLFFYRSRDKEVDFILQKGDTIIPVEVKYQELIKQGDLKNLTGYMRKKQLKKGFLITKNLIYNYDLGEGKKIYAVPGCLL
ncbi:ATP-binding protein [Candidatus Roizmanbacteria bacterium]|nr:ATP-binding protein [Candidatus Roizmanbacteria bacterium]